ncbi:MAG: hypothetical protein KIS92_02430 [Planctomycetota bacterium]|nr:hypothetical protein [Planctomycetota bacterium]
MSVLSIPPHQLGLVGFASLGEKDRALLGRVYELAKRSWARGQKVCTPREAEAYARWLNEMVPSSFIEELQGLGVESVARNRDLTAYFHSIKADRLTLFVGRIGMLQLRPSALERVYACAHAGRELAERIHGLTLGIETFPPQTSAHAGSA